MRDEMKVGDRAFFYHSSCPEPGIAGIVEVSRAGAPGRDPVRSARARTTTRSRRASNPRWVGVDVRLVAKTRLVPLAELRAHPALADMVILRRGNRLSITPVTAAEWKVVVRLARANS